MTLVVKKRLLNIIKQIKMSKMSKEKANNKYKNLAEEEKEAK